MYVQFHCGYENRILINLYIYSIVRRKEIICLFNRITEEEKKHFTKSFLKATMKLKTVVN